MVLIAGQNGSMYLDLEVRAARVLARRSNMHHVSVIVPTRLQAGAPFRLDVVKYDVVCGAREELCRVIVLPDEVVVRPPVPLQLSLVTVQLVHIAHVLRNLAQDSDYYSKCLIVTSLSHQLRRQNLYEEITVPCMQSVPPDPAEPLLPALLPPLLPVLPSLLV